MEREGMSFGRFHLDLRTEPRTDWPGELLALCGTKVRNPVAVPLNEETRSPLDDPRLCRHCKEIAFMDCKHYETAITEGQEALTREE
jgi:hypothetical protein